MTSFLSKSDTYSLVSVIRDLSCSQYKLTTEVIIFDEYKGKGYGLALYESALDIFGGIVSDDTLTSASFGVWKKLGQKYPIYKS